MMSSRPRTEQGDQGDKRWQDTAKNMAGLRHNNSPENATLEYGNHDFPYNLFMYAIASI